MPKTLRMVLNNSQDCLSAKKQALFAMQVAEALEFLHARSIVHLDVKSENVFVDEINEATEIVKLGNCLFLVVYL
jgi:serine/threonine protein kinase